MLEPSLSFAVFWSTKSPRRKIAARLLAGVLAVGGVWFWSTWPPPDPLIKGIPLSKWLERDFQSDRLLEEGTFEQSSKAVEDAQLSDEDLISGGPAVTRYLIHEIRRNYHPKKYAIGNAAAQSPLWIRRWLPVQSLGYDRNEATRRQNAVRKLSRMGPLAEPAIPTLRALLDDDGNIASLAASAINGVGPASWPTVENEMSHRSSRVRRILVGAIFARLIPPAPEPKATEIQQMVDLLIKASRDSDYEVRWKAVEALCNFRIHLGKIPSLEPVAAIIIERLNDSNPYLRNIAADSLYFYGAEARVAATPALQKLLADPETRDAAKRALDGIPPPPQL